MWDDSYDDSASSPSPVQKRKGGGKSSSTYDFPTTKGSSNNRGKKKSDMDDIDMLFSQSSASESNSPISDKKEKKQYNENYALGFTQKPKDYLANLADSGDLEDSILGGLLGIGGGGKKSSKPSDDKTLKKSPPKLAPLLDINTKTTASSRYSKSSNSLRFSDESPLSASHGQEELEQSLQQSRPHFNSFDMTEPESPKHAHSTNNANATVTNTTPNSVNSDVYMPTKPLTSTAPTRTSNDFNFGNRRRTEVPTRGARTRSPDSSSTSPPPPLSRQSSTFANANANVTSARPNTTMTGLGKNNNNNNNNNVNNNSNDGNNTSGEKGDEEDGEGGGGNGFIPSFLDPGRTGRRRR